VKARYRIGTTSFVHPAGWLDNARRLAGRVRDVELLLFEPPTAETGPSQAEIAALARLGRDAGLTYTVHAPLGPCLGSTDAPRRRAGVESVLRTIDLAAPLAPQAIVLHLDLGEAPGSARPSDLAAWRRRAARSLRDVLACGVAPRTLCLETLDYDFALAEPVVEDLGLSVALDVGHLARDGVPWEATLSRNLARTRVAHWHGTDRSGRDHRSLRHYPRADAVRLVRALATAGWDGVLTLEVFGAEDLDESLRVLADIEAEALS
jgi:sugar phosphate isomerase/epimerase